MSRKKIGLFAVGAIIVAAAALAGGTRENVAAVTEPTPTLTASANESLAPSVAPATSPTPDPTPTSAVPNAGHDLDCADIGFQVAVIGPDEYRLDRDHDGGGCESY